MCSSIPELPVPWRLSAVSRLVTLLETVQARAVLGRSRGVLTIGSSMSFFPTIETIELARCSARARSRGSTGCPGVRVSRLPRRSAPASALLLPAATSTLLTTTHESVYLGRRHDSQRLWTLFLFLLLLVVTVFSWRLGILSQGGLRRLKSIERTLPAEVCRKLRLIAHPSFKVVEALVGVGFAHQLQTHSARQHLE